MIASVRGAAVHGLHWPGSIAAPVLLSFRVPPRSIAEAITAARAWGATEWIAQHGVGVIDVGLEDLGTRDLEDVRREIDALSGVVVVDRWPADRALHDRFGVRADSAGVEDRLRSLFDPHGILAGPSRWERD